MQFDIPKQDVETLSQIDGFKYFNPANETFDMMKPIHGLKDALRAWRKKSLAVLVQWLSCKQLHAEFELYVVHEYKDSNNNWIAEPPAGTGINTIERAIGHVEEQTQEINAGRVIEEPNYDVVGLICLSFVHVGNIKGTARRKIAESLLAHLNSIVGQCKVEWGTFIHIGIQREHQPGQVYIHQNTYIEG